jgi:alpha-tubulin suppressor-like RCC1 family protein
LNARRAAAFAAAFGAGLLATLSACGLLIGTGDYQLFPADGGAPVEASADVTLPPPPDGGPPTDSAVVACDAALCDGACVDPTTDPASCGACGHACAAAQRCYASTCGGSDVVQLAVGIEHACALLRAGEVWCWGSERYAQVVGAADASVCSAGAPCRPAPTRVDGLSGIVEIAAGYFFTCARAGDGAVACWGLNSGGALGHAPTADPLCGDAAPCQPRPTAVAGLPGPASRVVAGAIFACALAGGTGSVYCWGDDTYAELGPASDAGSPSPVHVMDGVADLVAGVVHACALAGGAISCWGSNPYGELGHVPGAASGDVLCPAAMVYCNASPQGVNGLPAAPTGLHAGLFATCADTSSGPYCWGYDGLAELGRATFDTTAHWVPMQVAAATGVSSFDLRFATACAIDGDGGLVCYGDDETHETAADGGAFACTSGYPCQLLGRPVPIGAVAEVRTSAFTTVARTRAGGVLAWGSNSAAQLGHTPGGNGDRAGCDPVSYPDAGTLCNAVPSPVVGLP